MRLQSVTSVVLKHHIAALGTPALLAGLMLLPASQTDAAELTASDGAAVDYFGYSVSQSNNTALISARYSDPGSAYIFRYFDIASGTVTENVKLTVSDAAAQAWSIGTSVSQSNNIALIGALSHDDAGFARASAYVFRNIDTASGTVTENVKLTASDAAANDQAMNTSVSLSGNTALLGSVFNDGSGFNYSAYLFRNIDTASGTVTENVKLTTSDATMSDQYGGAYAVSLEDNTALVGIYGSGNITGSAYLFRDLNTASGTITENAKLTASDAVGEDYFGTSVYLSDNSALIGARGNDDTGSQSGSAYLFRNIDAASGNVTENVKLIASDAARSDQFGSASSLSGNTALVGAYSKHSVGIANTGSAYLFLNLDTASGTIMEHVKLTPSDPVTSGGFGYSVSLEGDQFLIGAHYANGIVDLSGKAYSGSVSSVTTLNEGNASRSIDGISFVSQNNWIIGQDTDSNQVTLSSNDIADIRSIGKSVSIGQNTGSDENTLILSGTLLANDVYIGSDSGNSGNALQIKDNSAFDVTNLFLANDNTLSIEGDYRLAADLLTFLDDTILQVENSAGSFEAITLTNLSDLLTRNFDGQYTTLLAATSEPSPSVVQYWSLEKGSQYTQASDNTAPSTADFCFFLVEVETVNADDATAATLTGSHITGSLPLSREGNEWYLEQEYVSEALLYAAHPVGATYTITLSGGDQGTITQNIISRDLSALNTPYLTGSDFTDAQLIDASADFDFNWGDAGSATYIEFVIYEGDFNLEVDASDEEMFTLGANELAPDSDYSTAIHFTNEQVVSGAGGFGVDGAINTCRITEFSVSTFEIPAPSDVVEYWALEKGAYYTQANNNTAPSTTDSWFFSVEVETANVEDATSATLSGSHITGSLPLSREGTEWTLKQEYASEALLNAAHPVGATYTITLSGDNQGTITQSVTFSALTTPNTPYLTGSDFTTVQSIDASADFDFHWNDAESVTNIEIEIYEGDFSVEVNVSDEVMFTLAADELAPDSDYSAEIYFANEQMVSGSGGFEVDGSINICRITEFSVSTIPPVIPATPAVEYWALEKEAYYTQASNNSAPSTADSYSFLVDVETANADDATSATLSGSHITGSLPLSREGTEWTLKQEYASEALLNAAHPVGATYTITLSGDNLGTITQNVTFSAQTEPNTPYLTGADFTDAQSIDASADFDFHWGDAGSATYIELEIYEGDFSAIVYMTDDGFGTLAADDLAPDSDYSAEIYFANEQMISGAGGFEVDGSINTCRITEFSVSTYDIPDLTPAVEYWALEKAAHYTQTSDNTEPNTADHWCFLAEVETVNADDVTSATLSGSSITGSLPLSREGTEWYLEQEYASEALLNTAHPVGATYTITLSGGDLGTITQDIQTTGVDTTIPYLTGTVWSDAMEIDPTAAFDFTWAAHADATALLSITSLEDEEGDEFFRGAAPPNAASTTMTIPAGTITAGGTAYGSLEFIISTEISGSEDFGVEGFVHHLTKLSFPLAALSSEEVIDDAFASAGLTDPADLLPTATPFNDGVENLLKYAFNMDLTGPDSSTLESGGNSGLPAAGLEEVDGEAVWQIEFVRPKYSGLIYTPKKSTTLAPNSFVPMAGTVTTLDLGNGLERVTITEPCDPTTTPTSFSRVEVALPE